ncbi:MAG: hypothetical protein J4G09_09055 [Proteobacteria bacterium]|nr:hypothetical protein [Pseudomonadota bacterium]
MRFDTLVSRIAEAQRRGRIVRSIPPEIVYALGLSFGIGWLLFGDLLMLALKVHPTRADEFRAQVPEAAAGLLQGRVGTNSADASG